MEAEASSSGYDAVFVGEVPDYLQCSICFLVLRDPVLLIQCGHTLCKPCFERMVDAANSMEQEIRCPKDRLVINITEVCPENGLKRVIGNLPVRCSGHIVGCPWQGELRQLSLHEQSCQYPKLKESGVCDVLSALNKLEGRVEKCEQLICERDEEISHLKHNVQEKSEIIDLLKEKELKMERDLRMMKMERNADRKKLNEMVVLVNGMRVIPAKAKDDPSDEVRPVTRRTRFKRPAAEIASAASEVDTDGEVLLTTRRTKSERCAAKEASAKIKKELRISLEQYVGDPHGVFIFKDNSATFFSLCTIAAPQAIVTKDQKAYFEVTVRGKGKGNLSCCACAGWSAKLFKSYSSSSPHVGVAKHSWGFDAHHKALLSSAGRVIWGKELAWGDVLGVALDMSQGHILYSCNGSWDLPMGTAFRSIDTNLELFPAITGCNVVCQVNFGEKPFHHGPPDDSFKCIHDL